MSNHTEGDTLLYVYTKYCKEKDSAIKWENQYKQLLNQYETLLRNYNIHIKICKG